MNQFVNIFAHEQDVYDMHFCELTFYKLNFLIKKNDSISFVVTIILFVVPYIKKYKIFFKGRSTLR